jgi:hypothetical protein
VDRAVLKGGGGGGGIGKFIIAKRMLFERTFVTAGHIRSTQATGTSPNSIQIHWFSTRHYFYPLPDILIKRITVTFESFLCLTVQESRV